jgi:hypothetical protein
MKNKLFLSLFLVLSFGLIVSAYPAERMAVCEELYQEG